MTDRPLTPQALRRQGIINDLIATIALGLVAIALLIIRMAML